MQKKIGSCLCSDVQFEIEGNFESFFLCHCKYCQKDSGSAHSANLFSQTARLHWLKGKQNVSKFNLPNSRHAKAFCKNCGSALPFLQMNDQLLVVPAGSLDSDITLKPNAHLFVSSRCNWDFKLEEIKEFEKLPADSQD